MHHALASAAFDRARPSAPATPQKTNLKREEVVSQRAQSNPSYGIPRDHHPHPLTSATPGMGVVRVARWSERGAATSENKANVLTAFLTPRTSAVLLIGARPC